MSGKKFTRNRTTYFKYKAPIYHKQFVPITSTNKPRVRSNHLGNITSIYEKKYGITLHAIKRYLERFEGRENVKLSSISKSEKKAICKRIADLLPTNFRKCTVKVVLKFGEGHKAVISGEGVVITIINKEMK